MTAEYFLAIDYGEKRVGIAVAHEIARLPRPLLTVANDVELQGKIIQIIHNEGIKLVVVGLPRNMDGSLGFQAESVKQFVGELAAKIDQPIVFIEETLSSVEASKQTDAATLKRVGIDAAAAAVILGRYLAEHPEGGETTNEI